MTTATATNILRLDQHDNGKGYPLWWLTLPSGVRRRASDEEVTLWLMLQEARMRADLLEQAAEQRAKRK